MLPNRLNWWSWQLRRMVNAVNFNIRMYPLVQQARSMVQSGELGDMFILQGSYLQDWLLLPTDWNWRLEPDLGGSLRAVGDIGSHWLDLLTFITGLRIEEVYADFKTFHPIRKKPSKPLETYTGKILTPKITSTRTSIPRITPPSFYTTKTACAAC
jgi:predicted dehydrogenase